MLEQISHASWLFELTLSPSPFSFIELNNRMVQMIKDAAVYFLEKKDVVFKTY